MTVWAEGSDHYATEKKFRTIAGREFVRRFRQGVKRQELAYTWLIGAGCSVSSGVPAAAECVRGWARELKYLETGVETEVDGWAASRFVRYDAEDPASIYAEALQALYYTEQDRRREIERLIKSAEPGFGYATLAQLMTHETWGARANLALSPNFDELIADALYLYSQFRPQTFSQETLGLHTPIAATAPTVVKLHGDAHLPRDGGNRPELAPAARERLRELIADRGLIIVGYGGRDESILGLLEELPRGAPLGGVYWVNEHPPRGAFADWLADREAIWVRHADFDELMYFVRLEFGLGHPKIDRFERILRKYEAQYRELSTRSGLGLSETPAQNGAPSGGGTGGTGGGEGGDGGAGGDNFRIRAPGGVPRRETDSSRRKRMKESLNAVTRALSEAAGDARREPARDPAASAMENLLDAELLDAAVSELHGGGRGGARRAPDVAEPTERPRRDQGDGAQSGRDGGAESLPPEMRAGIEQIIDALGEPSEIAIPADGERPDPRARRGAGDDADRGDLNQIGRRLLERRREDGPTAPPAPRPPRGAAATGGVPPEPIGRLNARDASAQDAAFRAALDAAPDDAALRARYARFLCIGLDDVRGAEAAYEEAEQSAPDSVAVLREYAMFALDQLRDAPRAERLLARALNLQMRNTETLRTLAAYLLRARGDFDQAETCHRLAVEVEPNDPRGLIAYGRFCEEQRGRRDVAETLLRRAADQQPRSPRAIGELAYFLASAAQSVDAAEKALADADQIGADEAEIGLARAAIAERKGALDEAEAQYRRAIELNPREMRAQIGYAHFLSERRGALKLADVQFRRAIEASPSSGLALSARAAFFDAHMNDPETAEALHRDALERDVFNPTILCRFAQHLAGRPGMADEAESLFRDALALNPRSGAALRAYARFLEMTRGDNDQAEALLRRAVDADPHGVESHDALANFLHRVREDAEEAEIYFREALRLAPNRAETLHRFALFLRDTRRDLSEAEDYFRRAVTRNPRDAGTLARAAQFLLAEGQRMEGLRMLNDAFDAAWRMDQAARPPELMLELWLYRCLHDGGRRDEALTAIMGLIDAGVRIDGWELGPNVQEALRAGHPDPELMRDLVRVATEGAPREVLRNKHRL